MNLLRGQSTWFVVGMLLLTLVGCGGGSDGMAEVRGQVTVDGQPAADGSISFSPVDKQSRTTGAKIVGGSYQAEAPVGKCTVVIRIPRKVGQRKLYDTPDSPIQPIMEESLPAKYNDESDLQIEVIEGGIEHNFSLSSK